ncbi:MAG TPA: hypothetical protein VNT30_09880 [Stellaceae bacterium]|nr:hypothetical protein [Stellaceae bacterium]
MPRIAAVMRQGKLPAARYRWPDTDDGWWRRSGPSIALHEAGPADMVRRS